jgi:hypothetical protein
MSLVKQMSKSFNKHTFTCQANEQKFQQAYFNVSSSPIRLIPPHLDTIKKFVVMCTSSEGASSTYLLPQTSQIHVLPMWLPNKAKKGNHPKWNKS